MLESELFGFLEGTADAAFAVDEQGIIRSWNRAAEKLFGYPNSSVLNKPCAQLFQGRGALGNSVCQEDCAVLTCFPGAHPENYDLEVKSRSGHRLWVNVSIIEFRDPRLKVRLHIHLARDITTRKKREESVEKVLGAAKDLITLAPERPSIAPVSPLTAQEKRVLKILSEGKSPAESARLLNITDRTLRNHLHHANQKLGTKNRLEAVIHAVRRGLI
jgi:PAS domain S-box-containing protein